MSKTTSIVLVIAILVVAALAVWLWQEDRAIAVTNFDECVAAGNPVMESYPRQCRSADGQLFVEELDEPLPGDDDDTEVPQATTDPRIRVNTPAAHAVVSSPLTISGEARGTWYFEASFPVRLLDTDGNDIPLDPPYIQAQGEWMTEDFVPFNSSHTFSLPSGVTSGVLVLQRDNPSGLPENAAEVRIPVRFSESAPEMMTVRAYFTNANLDPDPNVDCSAVFPVTRAIPRTQGTARAALTELLKGPSAAEESQGYATGIPSGVTLQDIRIENGTAYADFSSELNQVGGSCLVTSIRGQIEDTLLQFPTVTDVVISVNGNSEEALQP
jgi:hypothetical protein